MEQFIIVEGPDRVGKTTLIEFLKQKFKDVVVIKFTGPIISSTPLGMHDEQEGKSRQLLVHIHHLLNEGKMVMCDRSHIGEFVYSKIYNRPFPRYLSDLHRQYVALNPLILYLDGKPRLENATPTDIYLAGRHKEVSDLFWEFFQQNQPHRVMCINNENFGSLEERNIWIYNSIVNDNFFIPYKPDVYAATAFSKPVDMKFSISTHPFMEYHNSISLVKNSVVRPVYRGKFKIALFGEAPGYKGCGLTHIPFYYDKSGMLLRRVFFEFGSNLDFMFISNVFHLTPPENKLGSYVKLYELQQCDFNNLSTLPEWLHLEMEMFKRDVLAANCSTRTFLAIGKIAEAMLNKIKFDLQLDIDVIPLRHPAWFLYKHQTKQAKEYYANKLKEFKIEVIV